MSSAVSKRVFDIIFSIFALLLTSILMIIISILIKIFSPNGPIFFRQKRLGLNGKEFEVLKFRTMIPNAEDELKRILESDPEAKEEYLKYRKLKNDTRIIKGIGSFLRKTSLDELPQFINVLVGEMSIVGPRPYMMAEFEGYPKEVVDKITSVKPGITGYWQTIPNRNNTTFNERVKKDLEYIEKRCLWLDMVLVFKTVGVMALKSGV